MSALKVSILIPNYKTFELTKLCLRLIRKYTDLNKASVIVIDNNSNDASLDYLRTLSWIKLIERKGIEGESAVLSHSRALDLGFSYVTTPYVLSIHTDTLIKHRNWLPYLITHLEDSPKMAGVGSWKLEDKPWWKIVLKKIEKRIQLSYYLLRNKAEHAIEGTGKNYFYLRSHCAMYRTDVIRNLNLSFSDGDGLAGKEMHKKLVQAGFNMKFIPSFELIKYLDHINHATTILNPELSRQKNVSKGLRKIEKNLARMNANALLHDESLDH